MNPWWLFVSLCVVITFGALPLQQQNSLMDLYVYTGGSSWIQQWTQQILPCTLFGVTCDQAQNTVLSIILPSNNLTGSLPNLYLPDLIAL